MACRPDLAFWLISCGAPPQGWSPECKLAVLWGEAPSLCTPCRAGTARAGSSPALLGGGSPQPLHTPPTPPLAGEWPTIFFFFFCGSMACDRKRVPHPNLAHHGNKIWDYHSY